MHVEFYAAKISERRSLTPALSDALHPTQPFAAIFPRHSQPDRNPEEPSSHLIVHPTHAPLRLQVSQARHQGSTRMAPKLSEDDIDDLIYFARAGEVADLNESLATLSSREGVSPAEIITAARDEGKSTCLHMATGNGNIGTKAPSFHLLPIHPPNLPPPPGTFALPPRQSCIS